jgi:hypothetical protein
VCNPTQSNNENEWLFAWAMCIGNEHDTCRLNVQQALLAYIGQLLSLNNDALTSFHLQTSISSFSLHTVRQFLLVILTP